MKVLIAQITNPLTKINGSGYGELTGSSNGPLTFFSNVLRVVTMAAGLYAFINVIVAGFTYISAGSDSKKTTQAWSQIYMSLIGLVVIVASYAIAAIAGLLLFGSPTAILAPKIYGPGL